jgi:hypothetical protein
MTLEVNKLIRQRSCSRLARLALPALVGLIGLTGCSGDSEPSFVSAPVPPGSRQPEISGGEDGLLLSWVEGDEANRALRYARLSGGRWTEARTIVSDEQLLSNWAHPPVVTMLGERAMASTWPSGRKGEQRAVDIAFSFSPDGENWGQTLRPGASAGLVQSGWAAIVPEGGDALGLISLEGGSGATRLVYRRFADTAFDQAHELDAAVCPWCRPSAVRVGDDLVVAYRNHTEEQVRDVFVVRRSGDEWGAPRRVHEDGWRIATCPVNGPALAANDQVAALAWFTASGGEPRVLLARSEAGTEFGQPVRIDSGDPLGRVDAAMLDDGTVYVSWLEKSASGARVQVRAVSVGGDPGETRSLGSTDPGTESGFPRIARANGRLYVAWVEPSKARVRLTSFRP